MKTLSVKYNDRALIDDIMASYPEAGQYQMRCLSWNYKACSFLFIDETTGKKYSLSRHKLERAFKRLMQDIMAGKLPGLGITLDNFQDAGNWDCYASDALIQMACLGDVVYG